MKTARRFKNEYADDGKAKRLAVREASGHRCVRCGHPFESGKHGKGEWSPCDEQCSHLMGHNRIIFDPSGIRAATIYLRKKAGDFVKGGGVTSAEWRILAVHHLDGDKSNDTWWNTLALCQRCHLQIQTRLDPRIPYFLEHSDWFKIYAAGFYAFKYDGKNITREEATKRLDELLAYELRQ